MESQDEQVEKTLYVIDSCAKHFVTLQQYTDSSQKQVWFNVRTKRIEMGRTIDSNRIKLGAMGCSMVMSLSRGEFIQLLNNLDSIRVDESNPHVLIDEGRNFKKQPTRLVFHRSGDFNVPAISRLYAQVADEDDTPVSDNPTPVRDDNATRVSPYNWEEEFAKFLHI